MKAILRLRDCRRWVKGTKPFSSPVCPSQGLPSYRCVGAFHHQWCFGTLPLRAVRCSVREFCGGGRGATISPLGVVWTVNLEKAYFTEVTLEQAILNANMGCWSGNNEDGISVIDITNREATPLSAYGYLACYYDCYYDLLRTGMSVEGDPDDEEIDDVVWLHTPFRSITNLAGLSPSQAVEACI
ncbi:hypothetical protein C8Q74DRAFT_930194 [Fomes fomentarius]|nr:hypothetical protein C8Q74DRAFT_930194 [Fomes fomentarius]